MTAFRLAVAALLLAAQTAQAQAGDYRIGLSIAGKPVPGSQERARGQGGNALPDLVAGNSFQMAVKVTDSDGKTADLTGSDRLLYDAFGCMMISKSGFATVLASAQCKTPDRPELRIVLTDPNGTVIGKNDYVLRVK